MKPNAIITFRKHVKLGLPEMPEARAGDRVPESVLSTLGIHKVRRWLTSGFLALDICEESWKPKRGRPKKTETASVG